MRNTIVEILKTARYRNQLPARVYFLKLCQCPFQNGGTRNFWHFASTKEKFSALLQKNGNYFF